MVKKGDKFKIIGIGRDMEILNVWMHPVLGFDVCDIKTENPRGNNLYEGIPVNVVEKLIDEEKVERIVEFNYLETEKLFNQVYTEDGSNNREKI